MKTIQVRARVGADGILHLQFPTGLKETALDVVVTFHPVESGIPTDERGWDVRFFEKVAGSIPDFPLDADDGFMPDETEDAAVNVDATNSHER